LGRCFAIGCDQDIVQLGTLKVGTLDVVQLDDETPAAELALNEFQLTGPQSDSPVMFVFGLAHSWR
jgi:hypothetical protein